MNFDLIKGFSIILSFSVNFIYLFKTYNKADKRIRQQFINIEISFGNYVLYRDRLSACILVAIGRLIPGVLNDESSALLDSFQDNLLAPPVYKRPAEYKGWKVSDILLSGNERFINKWRDEMSLKCTEERRPDLL